MKDPKSCEQLCPVSTTPNLAEVTESFIYLELLAQINPSLDPFHYSCLKGSSPTHNLVRLNHLTNEWVDKGNTIIEPLLADYRKSVPFNSLYYCCTKPESNGEQKTESAIDSWFPQKPSSVCRCTFCRRSQLWMGLNNVWCFPRYQAGCLAVLGCD